MERYLQEVNYWEACHHCYRTRFAIPCCLNFDKPAKEGLCLECVAIVPTYWVDSNCQHVLYPHPSYNLLGILPHDWSEMSFNRRRYPTTEFVEYDIGDLMNEHSGMMKH